MTNCRSSLPLRLLATVAGFAVTVALPGVAAASTANSTTAVSATVQATCSISAAALAFGTYTSVQLDGSTTISVTCTNTTPYNVGLDVGTGTGATVATRKLTSGTQTLGYSLYSNTARSTVWGPTIGTNTVTGTGSGAAQTLTVYGRIPAGQLPTPGSYADTITATITY